MTPDKSGDTDTPKLPGPWIGRQPPRPKPNGSRSSLLVASALTLASSALFAGACAHVPLHARASVRLARYLEAHRELLPRVADAMDRGHVALGMDQEQVFVVLGQPLKRTDYGGAPPAEVWLYPGERFHQDPIRTHGATLFRVVFIDGRLALFEPL